MGMGKIKALKIRSIGFFAPDFLHVAFLGFSAKKRLRQKLKVMSEILSVPASRNNFAKKDRIDYSCGGAACFWCCVICPEDADLAFIPAEVRLAITIKSMMMDTIIRISWTEQHLILDEFCKHRIFLPDCVTLWLKLFTFVKITIKSVSR